VDDYYKELEKILENVFIDGSLIKNIDILRFKADMNYYFNVIDFYDDIYAMFKNVYLDLENLITFDLIKARKYLTYIYFELIKMIPNAKDFNEVFNNDIEDIIVNNKLPRVSNIY
jgi:hypothetical protein